MKFNIPPFIAVVGLLTLGNISHAQDKPQVSLKVDLVAWGADISGLSLKAAKGPPVTAKAFQYSKELSYSGPALMEIHQNAEGAAALSISKGSPASTALIELRKGSPSLVALAELPLNSKRVTVLLSPAADHSFECSVIDDDPGKLPPGHLRIHNFSKVVVAFKTGGATKELKPRESFVVKPVNHQIVYELAFKKAGEWQPIENNIVRVEDTEQAQMIFLQSDDAFFKSSGGGRSGPLQAVVLRRNPQVTPAP